VSQLGSWCGCEDSEKLEQNRYAHSVISCARTRQSAVQMGIDEHGMLLALIGTVTQPHDDIGHAVVPLEDDT